MPIVVPLPLWLDDYPSVLFPCGSPLLRLVGRATPLTRHVTSIKRARIIANEGTIMTSKQKQPNIVFFLWDNLGWGEVGCYGGGVLR